ncbi:MAG: NAD(P)H-dependent glycerol-3-phosphate dehydrogenase [Clostridia bacterium]|nr:NAD(P)H-dependent glycerol-3-phosphate dehydrogenase [Clostridia bacterium]
MKFSVLGCGRWGSFLTWYLSSQGLQTLEWGRKSSKSYTVLKETGQNEYVKLNKGVKLTSNLQEAVDFADVIIISIKSQGLRGLAEEIKACGGDKKVIVLCMKGLEEDTGKRLTEIMIESGYDKQKLAVWVGPGHIQEFTQGKPNCMVIDGYDENLVKSLAKTLKSNLIRFYYGADIIGSEIGAAAKNVMGIAAGVLDGGGFKSLKGALMARGAREVSRLIKAMGGNELSAYGLCHLGDYETTLFSEFSHNRKFGEELYKGVKFDKLAEGVYTAKAMMALAKKYDVELPITQAVYNIVYENHDPLAEFLTLFSRKSVTEFR